MLKIGIRPYGPFSDRNGLKRRHSAANVIHANFQLRSFFYEKTPVKHGNSGIKRGTADFQSDAAMRLG